MSSQNTQGKYLYIPLALLTFSGALFISTHIGIVHEVAKFYNVSISYIILMISLSNLFYLIVGPLMHLVQKQKFIIYSMIIAAVLIALGSFGKFSCFGLFVAATIWTIIGCIGNSIIISIVLKVLNIIQQAKMYIIMLILYFIPSLAQNFNILYGFNFMYIAKDKGEDTSYEIILKIRQLNQIVSVIAIIFVVISVIILIVFRKQIENILYTLNNEQSNRKIKQQHLENTNYKQTVPILLAWSILMGLNLSYSQMFSVFLYQQNRQLSDKQYSKFGLFASLLSSTFIFYAILFSKKSNNSNYSTIFNLDVLAFFGSLIIQGYSAFPQDMFKDQYLIIFGMIATRVGFSSSFYFCIQQISMIFRTKQIRKLFYYLVIAFGFLGNVIINLFTYQQSLTLFCIIIWICIFITNQKYLQIKYWNTKIINGNIDENQQLRENQVSDSQINISK